MKNYEGYLKRKLGDNYALLAGGGSTFDKDFFINGTIKRYYNSNSNSPLIGIGSNNSDVYLWSIKNGDNYDPTVAHAGYSLKYNGALNSPHNYLYLIADKSSDNLVTALSIDENGHVGINGNPNDSYNLYINGTVAATSFTGDLSGNATTATSAGSATNATYPYIGHASGDANYALVFTTSEAVGYGALYCDNQWRSGITYNPSTNKFVVNGPAYTGGQHEVVGNLHIGQTVNSWNSYLRLLEYPTIDSGYLGAYFTYDGVNDRVILGTNNSGLASGDTAYMIVARGSLTVQFFATPTVNGTSISLDGHNHNDLYVTEVGVSTTYPTNLYYILNGTAHYFVPPFATSSTNATNSTNATYSSYLSIPRKSDSLNTNYYDALLRVNVTNSGSLAGAPSSLLGWIMDYAWDWDGGYGGQIFMGLGNGGLFYRTRVGGTGNGWNAWAQCSIVGHTHDDRYYTESESDGRYLKLSGNTTSTYMTGPIYSYNTDGLYMNSPNTDLNVWRVVGNGGSWADLYGFNLQYRGTRDSNENDLVLWAHNCTGTHVAAAIIKLDGQIYFNSTPYVGSVAMSLSNHTHDSIYIGNASADTDYAMLVTTATAAGYGSLYSDSLWRSGITYNPYYNKLKVNGPAYIGGTLDVSGTANINGSINMGQPVNTFTNYFRLLEYPNLSDSYQGAYIAYDGASNVFRMGTNESGASNGNILFLHVDRGSTTVHFASTPYVNNTAVSLDGHTHSTIHLGDASASVDRPIVFTTASAVGLASLYCSYLWGNGLTFNPSTGILKCNGTTVSMDGHTHDGRYIKLSGQSYSEPITGRIWFKDTSAIYVHSTNYDVRIWTVEGNGALNDDSYGFHLLYRGTGSGDDNTLDFYAHNQTGTKQLAYRVTQSGVFTFYKNMYAPNYYTSSDIRLKTNIIPISKNIKQFNLKKDNSLSYGFIALELERKHPELVSDGNMKTVNYNAAICLLLAKLENRLERIERELNIERREEDEII